MEAIKALVVKLMNRAVRRYIVRNRIKVIAVAGSIGKTSTVNAVRTVLAQRYTVHFPKTAYNTNKSVHLELFDLPFATSTVGWIKTVAMVLRRSLGTAPYEVLVIELGTDHPGELRSFAWLKPELSVLTAIAPEHMEHFKTLEAVAEEELSVAEFSRQVLANTNTVKRSLVPAAVAAQLQWYGADTAYTASGYRADAAGTRASFHLDGEVLENVNLQVLGVHSLDALTAAAVVGRLSGLTAAQITAGLQAVAPVKGRMQRLAGVDGVVVIDDSYNASPQACQAALEVLAQFDAPQRIAVLGMMNEMGKYSEQAHHEVGGYCDPAQLSLVVTIGKDANSYLAAAAEAKGCHVQRFDSPYAAGTYVRQQLKPGAAVLFKGSQNGVFAEEAAKAVLADSADAARLPRQSEYWLAIKQRQFADAPY